MKRLHIHLKTNDLDQSVGYYTALFGTAPDKRENDYAKWLLEDPIAHVSLSTHEGTPGIDHVGVSLGSEEELHDIAGRLKAIGAETRAELQTTCCYAKSNKYWSRDPQGTLWELFQSYDSAAAYGSEPSRADPSSQPKTF